MLTTVRDATFEVCRRVGLTTVFANPGSTEIALLSALPDDIEFVLALREASVVGMATGWALAQDRPALALLHTTAGLGNAVGALATARVNSAADLWQHPQLQARARWVQVDSPAGPLPALLPPGSNNRYAPRMDAVPALGQHTQALLEELGFGAGEIEGWRREGVI